MNGKEEKSNKLSFVGCKKNLNKLIIKTLCNKKSLQQKKVTKIKKNWLFKINPII
jgi:hypothetical protein